MLSRLFIGLCVASLPVSASAQHWVEVGDAPETPDACGQGTAGKGPLLTITGTTDTTDDDFVDAYVIDIVDAAAFVATTSGVYDPAASAGWNTRLFLFDTDGFPLLGNDDAPDAPGAESYLSDPAAFPGIVDGAAEPLTNGLHVLVITGWANDPEDAAGSDLFTLGVDDEALFGPAPMVGPYAAWENVHGTVMSGTYTIALQGVSLRPGGATCPADVNCDGSVDVQDLLEVILAWGDPSGPADVNGDGAVGVADLSAVIVAWGPC